MKITLKELRNQLVENESVFIGAYYSEIDNLPDKLASLDFSEIELPKRKCVKAGTTFLRFATDYENAYSTLYFSHAKNQKTRCEKYKFENAIFLIYRVEKQDGTLYTMCVYAIPKSEKEN